MGFLPSTAASRAASAALGSRGWLTSVLVILALTVSMPPMLVTVGGWLREPLGGFPSPSPSPPCNSGGSRCNFRTGSSPSYLSACRRRPLHCSFPSPAVPSCAYAISASAGVGYCFLAPPVFGEGVPPSSMVPPSTETSVAGGPPCYFLKVSDKVPPPPKGKVGEAGYRSADAWCLMGYLCFPTPSQSTPPFLSLLPGSLGSPPGYLALLL